MMKSLVILALAFFAMTAAAQTVSYSTNFQNTEAVISEGGRWLNGKALGIDWKNVTTTPGHAFGTQNGSGGYDDSTAVLSGSWGPDQSAEATVFVLSGVSHFAEVELRLRTTISPHSITGYEFNCSIVGDYMQIVRWNGPLGAFTMLDGRSANCKNGDVIKATAAGDSLSLYKNGVLIVRVHDSVFTAGSPGIGMYMANQSPSVNSKFGFSSFTGSASTGSGGLNPIITAFTATPASFVAPGSSVLNAFVANTTQTKLDGVLTSFPITVSPASTHTYMLEADGVVGTTPATATVTVTVLPPYCPYICTPTP